MKMYIRKTLRSLQLKIIGMYHESLSSLVTCQLYVDTRPTILHTTPHHLDFRIFVSSRTNLLGEVVLFVRTSFADGHISMKYVPPPACYMASIIKKQVVLLKSIK